MRRLGLRGVVTTALAVLVIPLACAGGAAAASTSVWPSAGALGLPGGAAAVSLSSVSCGSSTTCVAAGAYSASPSQPMMVGEASGTWSAGTAITLPSGATSGALGSVSCTSAGNCTAVGDEDSAAHPIVAIQTSGAWGAATAVTGTAGTLSGVSCISGGTCSAVGSNGSSQPLAMTGTAGSFADAPTQPTVPSGGTSGALTSVACTTSGNCLAVGNYKDASGQTQAMIATETGGGWAAATEVPLPTGAVATGQNATLSSVSCPASGKCIAVGSYVNGAAQNAAMVYAQGSTQAAALSLPAGATASALDSISCTSSTSCTATGSVTAGSVAPLGATDSGGTWSAGTALPTPAGAGSGGPITLAVACTAAEQCQAAGTYPASGGLGAMALASHPSLVITSHSLPAGAIGSRYSAKIGTSGGTGGNAWTLTGGSLPAGLTFNASSGTVSGTPTTDQTTTFSVSVHDNATPPDQAAATLSLTIGPRTKPAKTTTGKGASGKGSNKKKSKKTKGAKVGGIKVLHGSEVHFTVKCLRQKHCDGRVAVVVVEHLKGKKVIAINASTHRARGTRTRTVWLGSFRYKLRSGKKVTHTIRLNRTGTRLLKARHKLKAGVALRPASFKRANIEHTVKLHVVKPKKHGKNAKHKKKKGTHSA